MLNNIENNFSLLKEYNIDIDNLPVDCDDKLKLNCEDKKIIVEKLLEAHKLACANVKAGNITNSEIYRFPGLAFSANGSGNWIPCCPNKPGVQQESFYVERIALSGRTVQSGKVSLLFARSNL